MTLTSLGLANLALAFEPGLRRQRASVDNLPRGLVSAAGLYGLFLLGDRLSRALLPRAGGDIADMYAWRDLGRPLDLAVRLGLIIAPAEELFWRGLIQSRLASDFGGWRGWLLATAAYGGAHVTRGNLTLVGASTLAGAYWGILFSRGMRMPALMVSHAAFDLMAFLVAPLARHEERRPVMTKRARHNAQSPRAPRDSAPTASR